MPLGDRLPYVFKGLRITDSRETPPNGLTEITVRVKAQSEPIYQIDITPELKHDLSLKIIDQSSPSSSEGLSAPQQTVAGPVIGRPQLVAPRLSDPRTTVRSTARDPMTRRILENARLRLLNTQPAVHLIVPTPPRFPIPRYPFFPPTIPQPEHVEIERRTRFFQTFVEEFEHVLLPLADLKKAATCPHITDIRA